MEKLSSENRQRDLQIKDLETQKAQHRKDSSPKWNNIIEEEEEIESVDEDECSYQKKKNEGFNSRSNFLENDKKTHPKTSNSQLQKNKSKSYKKS